MMNRAGQWCQKCAEKNARETREIRDRLGRTQVCQSASSWEEATQYMVQDCFRRPVNAAAPPCGCEPYPSRLQWHLGVVRGGECL